MDCFSYFVREDTEPELRHMLESSETMVFAFQLGTAQITKPAVLATHKIILRFHKLLSMLYKSLLERKPKAILQQLSKHLQTSMADMIDGAQTDCTDGDYMTLATTLKQKYEEIPTLIEVWGR